MDGKLRQRETANVKQGDCVGKRPGVRLHGLDENHATEVAGLLAYFRSLQRQLHLSVVLVHHTRKNAAAGVAAGHSLRGSSDLHAFGDSNLYLRRAKDRLQLSSEHRAAPPVYLKLVAADAATTTYRSSRSLTASPARRQAACSSNCWTCWRAGRC